MRCRLAVLANRLSRSGLGRNCPLCRRERRVTCHQYLQWLADDQLAAAQGRARAAGMRLGLYLDIAVGVAGHGADFWAEPEMFGRGVSLGAPPDAFDGNGQNWGLAPFNPHALRRTGYRAFADMLAAAMTRAGMIRIDHVLGFVRTFWIPECPAPMSASRSTTFSP
ncbi:MAG: 4-alpha-glucanotransferase [Hyphomicrobiales bacterium]